MRNEDENEKSEKPKHEINICCENIIKERKYLLNKWETYISQRSSANC